MSRFVLALDQGTTSSRAILFDHDGRVVALAQREFRQHFPRSGWVEHDAEEIWATQAATIAEVLARARAAATDIAAVGIANQRETTVLWDRRNGRPVAPAIVWQDRRTAGICARLKAAGHEAEIARRTGLLLDPYFSGTKLAWLLDSDRELRARAERGELAFGTIDSWLAWQLARGTQHITDATNASVQWLRDGLGFIEKSAGVEGLAGSVPDAGGVFLVPAFTGLGSPHWDACARGTMVGLSRGTTRAHIARAALGAACFAGLAVGFWNSISEVIANWRADRRFEPAVPREVAEARMAQWARAVERSRDWHTGD